MSLLLYLYIGIFNAAKNSSRFENNALYSFVMSQRLALQKASGLSDGLSNERLTEAAMLVPEWVSKLSNGYLEQRDAPVM